MDSPEKLATRSHFFSEGFFFGIFLWWWVFVPFLFVSPFFNCLVFFSILAFHRGSLPLCDFFRSKIFRMSSVFTGLFSIPTVFFGFDAYLFRSFRMHIFFFPPLLKQRLIVSLSTTTLYMPLPDLFLVCVHLSILFATHPPLENPLKLPFFSTPLPVSLAI